MAHRGSGSAGTILIVDDEAAIRQCLRLALARERFEVLEADNGVQALAAAERHGEPIDLLVTDVVMPELSGFELAEKLSNRHRHLQVLYISGCPGGATAGGPLRAGCEFLEKPFDLSMLLHLIREMMGRTAASARPPA
jgi:DNA-binding NtrC family response regulator